MSKVRARVLRETIVWQCGHCSKDNRTHIKAPRDVEVVICEGCGGEADIFPATVVVYEAPLLTTGEDAA